MQLGASGNSVIEACSSKQRIMLPYFPRSIGPMLISRTVTHESRKRDRCVQLKAKNYATIISAQHRAYADLSYPYT